MNLKRELKDAFSAAHFSSNAFVMNLKRELKVARVKTRKEEKKNEDESQKRIERKLRSAPTFSKVLDESQKRIERCLTHYKSMSL